VELARDAARRRNAEHSLIPIAHEVPAHDLTFNLAALPEGGSRQQHGVDRQVSRHVSHHIHLLAGRDVEHALHVGMPVHLVEETPAQRRDVRRQIVHACDDKIRRRAAQQDGRRSAFDSYEQFHAVFSV